MKAVRQMNKQRGNLLVSAAIAIGVSSVIGLAAMVGLNQYMLGKVNNEVQVLHELKNNTVKFGSVTWGPFTTTNAPMSTLLSMNFFPASMVSGTSVVHGFGGGVSTAVGTVFATGDAIVVNYGNFPANACIELVKKADSIAGYIEVNAVAVKAVGGTVNNATLTGNTACKAGENNTVSFSLVR